MTSTMPFGDITNVTANAGAGTDGLGKLRKEDVGKAPGAEPEPPRTPRTVRGTGAPQVARTPSSRSAFQTPGSARSNRTASDEMPKLPSRTPERKATSSAGSLKELRTPQPTRSQVRTPQSTRTPVRARTAVGLTPRSLASPRNPATGIKSGDPSKSSASSTAKGEQARLANELTQVQQNMDELKIKMIQAKKHRDEQLARKVRCNKQQVDQAQQLEDTKTGHSDRMTSENETETAFVATLEVKNPALAKEVTMTQAMTAGIDAKESGIQMKDQQIVDLAAAQVAMGEKEKEKVRNTDAIRDAFLESEASLDTEKRILAEGVVQNRQLHNVYLSLKGNIRVFCRLRPQLPSELKGEPLKVELQNDGQMTVKSAVQKSTTGMRDVSSTWDFDFDQVFPQDATQAAIFEEIALLVQSALDGYRVAIFAYGQTGSGKTYTMEGPEGEKHSADGAGMIPRTVDLIFSEMKEMKERGWSFQVHVTMIEVYNETVIDLLGSKTAKTPRGDSGDAAEGSKTPRGDSGDAASVGSEHRVESAAAVHHFLARAARERHVAATACNDRSSRSHSVFQLKLVGRCEAEGGREVEGLLSLVDLAGSERVEKSQATGDRLREAQCINRSLSALGDVVEALAIRGPNGNKHVPYRNSKLTMLLKESLGGEAKALMFVNVSMCIDHLGETISSLRFASKVHACNVGVAKRVAAIGGA